LPRGLKFLERLPRLPKLGPKLPLPVVPGDGLLRLVERPPDLPQLVLALPKLFLLLGALLLRKDLDAPKLRPHILERPLRLGVALVGGDRDPPVDLRSRHALQKLGPLLLPRQEKARKLPLRQEHRAAELLVGEPHPLLDRLVDLGARPPHLLPGLLVPELGGRRLDPPVHPLARTADGPPGAIAHSVPPDEDHLRMAPRRPLAQQVRRVGVREAALLLLASDGMPPPRHRLQPRCRAVERQADGVEDRALAGPRGPRDGEEPRPGQRLRLEVDRKGALEARQVLARNREDPHRAPSSISCTSERKASRSSGGGS